MLVDPNKSEEPSAAMLPKGDSFVAGPPSLLLVLEVVSLLAGLLVPPNDGNSPDEPLVAALENDLLAVRRPSCMDIQHWVSGKSSSARTPS